MTASMSESFAVEIDSASFARPTSKLNLCVNFKERCIVTLLKIENDVVDELQEFNVRKVLFSNSMSFTSS